MVVGGVGGLADADHERDVRVEGFELVPLHDLVARARPAGEGDERLLDLGVGQRCGHDAIVGAPNTDRQPGDGRIRTGPQRRDHSPAPPRSIGAVNCPACGANAPPEARFCPTCGHALVSRPDERRVTTLVFADLVGFTRLAQTADPEQVKRLVDTCFGALSADVTAYGGRVDKIVGDELVAIFGAPVAHEDDAERAVRCALQMQHTLANLSGRVGVDLQMRVGVNTGEVLVGALGGDITAMGDVVNTASRLESEASPGQVVVGESTYTMTADIINYQELGSLQVRGRDAPVRAWLAEGANAPPGRRKRARTRIFGREAELALLRGILDASELRRRAHLVIVAADAGVGKSRLVGEIVREAHASRDACVLRTHCLPYGESAWYPVAELIRSACGISPDASHDDVRDAVAKAIADSDHVDDEVEVARTTRGLLYVLGHPEAMHDIEPSRARDDAVWSAQQMLGSFARRSHLVVTCADLHWADESVLTMLERLVEGLRALPFTLIATARPELLDRWSPAPGKHNFTLLNLDPLDADAVAALAAELLGPDVDPELVTLLRERSGGNPFFVEELAALLRETPPEKAPAIIRMGKLPATLRGLVAARLDAIGTADRSVLEDCAVIGATGSVEAVRALSDARGDVIDVDDALAHLDARELVDVEGEEFSFPSEVVRTVAYGTLAKAERARRHAALADWLASRSSSDGKADAERAAHLYGAVADLITELGPVAGLPADLADRAVPVLELAASRAVGAELWGTAAQLYDRCLRLLPTDESDEHRWQLQLGRALSNAEYRDLPAAHADLDAVLEEAPVHSRIRARALTQLAEVRQMEGDYSGAFAVVDEALGLWRELGEEHGLATALRARGRTSTFTGDMDRADADCSEALTVYRRIGDRRGEAWALGNLATISFFRGDTALAEERCKAASKMFEELGDWGGRSFAETLTAWVWFMQSRLDDAEALALELLPETDARGDRYVSGLLEMLLGNIALWRGHVLTALERTRSAAQRFRVLGDPWAIGQATGIELRALAASGQVEEAIERLDRGEAIGMAGNPIFSIRAQVLVHAGHPEALAAALHLRGAEGTGESTLDADLRRTLGLAMIQAGRAEEGLAELQGLEGPSGPSEYADAAALALGLVANGRGREVREPSAEQLQAGTYLDRLQLRLGVAFARLQSGSPETVAAFDGLLADADETESRLDQAIVRLARAFAWRALGRGDAEDAMHEAEKSLAAAGTAAPGWVRVFAMASGAQPDR
jgi:class 3 adenylate cyclase/tetratricopeptide (TPR) repeat protein